MWDFVSRLSPSNQEAFAKELAEFVEAWEATADLDQAPEVLAIIRSKKQYRVLGVPAQQPV